MPSRGEIWVEPMPRVGVGEEGRGDGVGVGRLDVGVSEGGRGDGVRVTVEVGDGGVWVGRAARAGEGLGGLCRAGLGGWGRPGLAPPDAAYGLATGVAVAGAICAAVYLSYGFPAQAAYDLRHNTHTPTSQISPCWAAGLGLLSGSSTSSAGGERLQTGSSRLTPARPGWQC